MKKCIIPSIGSEEVIEIRLTPYNYPIAFKNKVDELLEQGAFNTKEDAEKWVMETPFVLELIYEKHQGLFAVESEALENTTCYSPYTIRDLVTEDED
jgi:hypothetical protein